MGGVFGPGSRGGLGETEMRAFGSRRSDEGSSRT